MTGYHTDIEEKTKNNDFFRQVLFTAPHLQLVAMTLQPNEDIGLEVHENTDQFFRFEEGEGKAVLNGEETAFKEDDVLIVPAGTEHNIINTSAEKKLKLYTIYAPPQHPDGTIHQTKEEAMASE